MSLPFSGGMCESFLSASRDRSLTYESVHNIDTYSKLLPKISIRPLEPNRLSGSKRCQMYLSQIQHQFIVNIRNWWHGRINSLGL